MSDITSVRASTLPDTALASVAVNGGTNTAASGNTLPRSGIDSAANSPSNTTFTPNDVKAAVAQLNDFIQSSQRDLHFSYDAEAGKPVVKVIDRTTQELIRQIPDETFLRISKALSQDEHLSLITARA